MEGKDRDYEQLLLLQQAGADLGVKLRDIAERITKEANAAESVLRDPVADQLIDGIRQQTQEIKRLGVHMEEYMLARKQETKREMEKLRKL